MNPLGQYVSSEFQYTTAL